MCSIGGLQEAAMTKKKNFPSGWDETRVKRVLEHYQSQDEDEAIAEDEAAFEDRKQTVMEIPHELLPVVRELLGRYKS